MDELAGQQAHRIGLRERGDLVLRQPGAFEEPADVRPDGTKQSDPAAPEPTADEPDGGAAGAVQPVQVVDDDEQRAPRCHLAE
jgi:hypothetical protein